MNAGDPVTVWVGENTEHGRCVRGRIAHFNTMVDDGSGKPRLYEWTSSPGVYRLISTKDLGIVWLPGWSDEIERALLAARALA